MPSESSKRSNLVDITYQQLHSFLSGHLEGCTPKQILQILRPRLEIFRDVSKTFGKPSDASKRKIETGLVTLADGVSLSIEDADREFVLAISEKFQIDQVNGLVLLRSFLYNEGLPSQNGSEGTTLVEELLEAITPFFYSERLYALRVLIPLFRANENMADPIHEIAAEILPQIIPDGRFFAGVLLDEYTRKSKEPLPSSLDGDPRSASRWAKQNLKEQLVMIEVLFWTMWGYVPCSGELVVRIFECAYSTNLGSKQQNSTLLLNDEGAQLLQDCSAVWILVTIEVLELERVGELDDLGISTGPTEDSIYTSSPESLKRIHELVTSDGNSQFACTYLAWAYVLSRLTTTASSLTEIPDSYRSFFDSLLGGRFSRDREPVHVTMAQTCLGPDVGFFALVFTLLTNSPLFVTSAAWRIGSTVTDPNAIAFRSVLKGLIVALVEIVPVELVPDFDALVEVWIALFGRSESQSVSGICRQFWLSDWRQGIARRAIFDVARSRFPIQFRPLVRLLRAMTASGFLDTDPLCAADHSQPQDTSATMDDGEEARELCSRHVLFYLNKLPTYSQVIPLTACSGTQALYEKQQERYGSGSGAAAGLTYLNLKPIMLPGGSTLPVKTQGRLLSSDGGEVVVMCWEHEHSGWKLVLEILTDFVYRKRLNSGSGTYSYAGMRRSASFGQSRNPHITMLRLEDIGVEMEMDNESGGEEVIVTDVLDLVRSVIHDNSALAHELLKAMEAGDPVVSHMMTDSQPPDLVQLTTMILEESLSRSRSVVRGGYFIPTQLITSSMSVLSALLSLPSHSNRVWLYVRSSTALFGSERSNGSFSTALSAERTTGHYTMTLALLHLVQQLFHEASSNVLSSSTLPGKDKLQLVKEEVLLNAVRFIHSEIWVEYLGWRYIQLGDRFEIGKRVTEVWADILRQSGSSLTLSSQPNTLQKAKPFSRLGQAVADLLLFKAAGSTILPLVSSISSGGSILRTLYAARRFGDARRLIFLLGSHLQLTRLVLNIKQHSSISEKVSLLEQSLTTRVSEGPSSFVQSGRNKLDHIDILASYVKDRDLGSVVPLEAMRVLYSLCASLCASQQSSSPAIVGHLADPEATVTSFVRIVQHPYDEPSLRSAVWNFISLAVDNEPALANLFIAGQFRRSNLVKGKGKAVGGEENGKAVTALDVARDGLENWRELWEPNPQLLASILRFLEAVWQHGMEHTGALESLRKDESFWNQLVGIAGLELEPAPEYLSESFVVLDGIQHSNAHDVVALHAYRTMVKSYALHIISLDIDISLKSSSNLDPPTKPSSYLKIEVELKAKEKLKALLKEATVTSYNPHLYDEFVGEVESKFPALSVDHLRSQETLPGEREFGDDYTFSVSLLRHMLPAGYGEDAMDDYTLEKRLMSINLNLSLADSQTALCQAWQHLLSRAVGFLRGHSLVRPSILAISASLAEEVASEKRPGDMAAAIHGTRLSLLVAVVEVAWFATADGGEEIQSFVKLVSGVHGIILNESQPPAKSFMGSMSKPFHRPLLQLVYFCSRHALSLSRRRQGLNAEQRLRITAMVEATLNLVTEALQLVIISARTRLDVELDRDMELLVAVFEQCTRPNLYPSSAIWLARCQETDVIRSSLDLFARVDIAGLSDLPLLLARKRPMYSPHLLHFHMALASVPSAAERLASIGVLSAYSNCSISHAASSGSIDVALAELPGERSPAHEAYCSMLSIVAQVVSALGKQNHYFNSEASGFIQLFGDQISRALSWTIGDSLNFPLLEEIEQTVGLFYAIAQNSPTSSITEGAVGKILQVFTAHALQLLQQLNYAVTHPHHLASLLEPVTLEERRRIEKESPIPENEDPLKRPLIAILVHKLFRLSGTIIMTLVTVSRAEEVLLKSREEWPAQEALIIPHSKVVLGEPASLGTLLEMGNRTLDVLRELVGRPAGQSIAQGFSTTDGPLDVANAVGTARQHLEALLVYSTTQLAMWLAKPKLDASEEMELDEYSAQAQNHRQVQQTAGEREPQGGRRGSWNLAERMRRGMTSDVAQDLHNLITKSRPILAKSDSVLGPRRVDVMQVLTNFLNERVIVSS